MSDTFRPKIIAFMCNWCSYANDDIDETNKTKYSSDISVIKVPCMGQLDPLFIMKAFETGADGVLIAGCHPDDCHYKTGNLLARRRWIVFKGLLEFMGIEPGRIHFSWVSAAENAKFVDFANKSIAAVNALGPMKRL